MGHSQIITFDTFINCGYTWVKKKKQLIPPNLEDRRRDWNVFSFRNIKKTFRTGLGRSSSQQPVDDDSSDDDESYNPFNEDIPTATSMDAFQTEIRDTFK